MVQVLKRTRLIAAMAQIISLSTASKLRGTVRNQQASSIKAAEIRRQLLTLDAYTFIGETVKLSQYDKGNSANVLNLLDKVQDEPTDRISIDMFTLPQTYDSNDYVGQLHGLLPTQTVYDNDNFYLSMDFREHRYEEVNLDIFGYIHHPDFQPTLFSQASQVIMNDDLDLLFDTRKIIGLMGLLPGTNPIDSLEDIGSSSIRSIGEYEKLSTLSFLDKGEQILNKVDHEAYAAPPKLESMNNWVGHLHGLLPEETIYHNDDFYLSFGLIENQYESMGHSIIDEIGKITQGDKLNSEAFASARIDGDDGKMIFGLIGLLPGTPSEDSLFRQGDVVESNILGDQYSSSSAFSVLNKITGENRVNPEAYENPTMIVKEGLDYVGQLHGLLPDLDNKMQFLQFSLDEYDVRRGEGGYVGATFVDLLGTITVSKTQGTTLQGSISGQDMTDFLKY